MSDLDLTVVGKKSEPCVFEYTWKDVVLYALGIGAQADELSFVYENAPGELKVFPSFSAIAAGRLVVDFAKSMDRSRFLHGEQLIRSYRPLPPEGKIMTVGEVANIFDKGKAAVIRFLIQGHTESGEHLFDVEHTTFYQGAGGFGGDPGPKAEPLNPPEGRKPDFSVSYHVPANQAALYRLNGDFNPLHLDPEFAKRGGFDTPILHGLCTYGYATRAIVYGLCDGDVSRFREFKARFSNVVYPSETLITEGWQEKGGRCIIQVRTDRAVVISNAYATVD
jgi:acyl dehydratase